MPAAFCPHCLQPIADDVVGQFPPRLMACPHCRLTIAAGRARDDGDGTAGASGSAAGLLASAARRDVAGAPVTVEVIDAALRTAAEKVSVPVARLRMIDYQRVRADDPALPPLGSILGDRGTWKQARSRAAERTG